MKNTLRRAQQVEQHIEHELGHGHRVSWFHLFIIVGSLIFTLVTWQLSKQQLADKVNSEFDREWSALTHLISDRMKNYEELLRSGIATMQSHDNVMDRLTWRSYSEELALEKRFPGALGVGVIFEIKRQDLPEFLIEQRTLEPAFDVHPPAERDVYYPITFIEPEAANRAAIGLDMAHELNRLTATLMARRSGSAVVTAPIQLVQGEQDTPGFLFFAPFYSEAKNPQGEREFLGLVYSPLVFKNLILGVLGQESRRVNFRLFDDEYMLFDELGEMPSEGNGAQYVRHKALTHYGRTWNFEFRSSKEFEEHFASNLPKYILAGGLVFELFYVVALLLLSNHRKNAVLLAKRLIDEYKASTQKGREIEQRYNLAIAGSAVGLWDWDLINDNLFWSDHFFDMLGVEKESNYVDLPFFTDRLHEEDREAVLQAVDDHFKTAKPFNTQYRLQHSEGHYVWIHAAGQALWAEDGSPIRMSGSASNITENRLAEEALLTLNSELTKFAQLASHDLKTPLRGISNLTQWIEEDQANVLDEENTKRLQMIRERVSLTQTMLQDILIYSESGNATLHTKWVCPSDMLNEIVAYMQLGEHQQVIFDKDIPEILTVATQLRQVFTNTISNAFDHHDQKQQRVEIRFRQTVDGLEFTVSDNGPGIPTVHHQRVFELFHTLKAKGKGGGSGLGMSIIKRLVEGQKGEVRIVSKDGERGTSICFTWPAILNQRVA